MSSALQYLPKDILQHTLSFFDVPALLALRRVCKGWYAVIAQVIYFLLQNIIGFRISINESPCIVTVYIVYRIIIFFQ